ncbi:hypothetical protein SERLA73DRAFT_142838 [Serpula lacrymans var. lacrymans S7.3]|uniref:Glutathione S-transferase n=3 Tax=Serpula lacrymans var. lacrymans TaxID=341189 RepID=F8Q8H9_SERL3|nr:glutathione s-transferase variant 2 [Serpula lacrymans var. lacrymans S7.9]EGN95867.1 hypothetical protein SERLA73DRAFT_142838 [Serpula lacrymans var. lacrymans S7.3]EGO21435.1 glutathione s-transferase variant 2 [Serpula lacrymans var. lacrymans S7.9]
MATVESYEIHYWPIHGRSDVSRMLLEAAGKPYKNVFIGSAEWATLKKQQRFGHTPWLVVKYTDGTSKTLWEQLAIDVYLAETFGFMPSTEAGEDEAFSRAFCVAHHTSWLELSDKFGVAMGLPTLEERREQINKLRNDVAPLHMSFHEKILAESKGPFYYGEKPTLPDFMALSTYLRMEELLGECSHEQFPNLLKLNEAVLKVPHVADYVQKRRDFGVIRFDKDQLKGVPAKQ